MKLNLDRVIIDTLFIVEGEDEKKILKLILGKLLGYDIVCQGNRDTKYLEFRKYENNELKGKIGIFCTEESYIQSIDNQEFIDLILQELVERYSFDIRNSCIFYLFDRDPKSNTDADAIRNLIINLKNPYDNDDFNYGGLILLSYPCLESYKISNFIDESTKIECGLGAELKAMFGKDPNVQDNKISLDTILFAADQMLKWYKENEVELDLENAIYNVDKCFEVQEDIYCNCKMYKLLSGLTCAFIELGIIEIE